MEDSELYYDLAKFEVEMLSTRSNFLLVFQSLLFAAVATLADKLTDIPQWPLILLGLFSSIVWFYINLLTVVQAEEAIKRLKSLDKRVEEVLAIRREKFPVIGSGSIAWIFSVTFPFLTGLVWFILLVL